MGGIKYPMNSLNQVKARFIKIMYIYKKYEMTKRQYMSALFKGMLISMTISYLFYKNLVCAVFFVPYMHAYIKNSAKDIQKKKKQELGNQFKDGMLAISFSLNVGYSIENSFKEALGELKLLYGEKSAIVTEFKTIIYRIDMNGNIEDALDEFAARSNIEDILYFAEVFRYAKRSGGDLIAIICNTANTISEKLEAKNAIETVISGKQMEQKIMSVIPFGIILYLKLSAPEFIEPLYGNIIGAGVMTVCLILYMISNCLAQKIVRIEV